MSKQTLFYMWDSFRSSLIEGHRFYTSQARVRLLAQFDNITSEAEKAGADWLASVGLNFDPDRHSSDHFYESAEQESISFYLLLASMRDNTRLSVVAGMYHEWDKQLREWMVREITHWHRGEDVRAKIWAQDFVGIVEFFASLGWDIRTTPYYSSLDACRLVVNVYKHGEGTSFEDLKQRYPEYIRNPFKEFTGSQSSIDFSNYTDLKISDAQILEFSEGITAFWKDVPERILDDQVGALPKWFERAWHKDSSRVHSSN